MFFTKVAKPWIALLEHFKYEISTHFYRMYLRMDGSLESHSLTNKESCEKIIQKYPCVSVYITLILCNNLTE